MIYSPPNQPAQMTTAITEAPVADQKFVRGLGLLDSTMLVAGSMIGSGIFIVSAIIARQVGSPGWLLIVWIVTGLLTLMAALSYGELAAMMALLTFMNTRGLNLGKLVQNIFTTAKTGALIALVVLGIIVGVKSGVGTENFRDFWTLRGGLQDVGAGLTAATAFGLFVGICV